MSGQRRCRHASQAGCCCRQRRACDESQSGGHELSHASSNQLRSPAAVRDHDGVGVHGRVLVNLRFGEQAVWLFGRCPAKFCQDRCGEQPRNCSRCQDAGGRHCCSSGITAHSIDSTAQHSTAQHSAAYLHPEVGEGGGQVLRAGEQKRLVWQATRGDATTASNTRQADSTTLI